METIFAANSKSRKAANIVAIAMIGVSTFVGSFVLTGLTYSHFSGETYTVYTR